MNKKCFLEIKNINSKKTFKEITISKKENKFKNSNKSYKSFSNIQLNKNNISNESEFVNIYKTILNGSLKNLKINEKNKIIKKK